MLQAVEDNEDYEDDDDDEDEDEDEAEVFFESEKKACPSHAMRQTFIHPQ